MNTIEVNIKSSKNESFFILHTKSNDELKFLNEVLKFMNFTKKSNKVHKSEYKDIPIIPAKKDADFKALAGIWKERKITLKELRNKAWGGRA